MADIENEKHIPVIRGEKRRGGKSDLLAVIRLFAVSMFCTAALPADGWRGGRKRAYVSEYLKCWQFSIYLPSVDM